MIFYVSRHSIFVVSFNLYFKEGVNLFSFFFIATVDSNTLNIYCTLYICIYIYMYVYMYILAVVKKAPPLLLRLNFAFWGEKALFYIIICWQIHHLSLGLFLILPFTAFTERFFSWVLFIFRNVFKQKKNIMIWGHGRKYFYIANIKSMSYF